MEDWEKIMNELDKSTSKGIDEFTGSLTKVSSDFYEKLVAATAQLKLRIGKSVPKSSEMAENLKKLAKLNAQIEVLLNEAGYKEEVTKYLGYFTLSKKAINSYYSAVVSTYAPSQELFEAIRKTNIDTTVESLLGSGIEANYIEPVKKILKDVVTGNGDYATLKRNLSIFIKGNEEIQPRLKAYSGQVAEDAIMQFQRNYIQAVSNDIGLSHYLYAGTEIKTTRDFCDKRHGKYYTEEEVKGWAKTDWAGKIRGTNETTIFTYCGGYRCRHRLLPVSETIYKANK